jgi:hypothetical protein
LTIAGARPSHEEPSTASVAEDYLEGLRRRPVLAAAVERKLVLAAKAGDPAARGELVEAFMPLIAAAARPYFNLHVQRVELLQEVSSGCCAHSRASIPGASGRSGPTPRDFWKMGLAALGLTLAVLVIAAALAPAIAGLSTPSATTADSAARSTVPPPTWATDPLAPPSLLRTR